VRSPESRGWVHVADLPIEIRDAMYERIELKSAPFHAAAERHPGWHLSGAGLSGAGYPQKIDSEAPEYSDLIEWFRNSFPREVHAIGAAIRDDLAQQRQQLPDTEPPF
jgi:hypothetical protein